MNTGSLSTLRVTAAACAALSAALLAGGVVDVAPAQASPGPNEFFIHAETSRKSDGVSVFLRDITWHGKEFRRGTARVMLTGVGYWWDTDKRMNDGPISVRIRGWRKSQPNRAVLKGDFRYFGQGKWVFRDPNRDGRWISPIPLHP